MKPVSDPLEPIGFGALAPQLNRARKASSGSKAPVLSLQQFGKEFQPVELEYVVKPYFPLGKAVLIDADGGTGKSSFAIALAAWFSRGMTLVGEYCQPGPVKVLYLHKGEDTNEELETVFRANGGDSANILYCRADELILNPAGLEWLKQTVIANGIKVVVIDALLYFLSGVVSNDLAMRNPMEAARLLQPLMALYVELSILGVHIRHTKKGALGNAPSELGLGTVQFRNSHRGQLLMRFHPDVENNPGVVVVTDEKGSILNPRGKCFCFRRVEHEVQVVKNIEGNPFQKRSDRKRPGPKPTKTKAAAQWLFSRLANGPRPIGEILSTCEASGFPKSTIYEAVKFLDVATTYIDGKKAWQLDPYADEPEWSEESE